MQPPPYQGYQYGGPPPPQQGQGAGAGQYPGYGAPAYGQQSYGVQPQPPAGQPGGHTAFIPQATQQQFSPTRAQYQQPANQQPFGIPSGAVPFMPAAPGSGVPPSMAPVGGDAAANGAPAGGFMSGLTSPLGLMAAGSLLSGPQAYMQQRVSWLRSNTFTGTMSALFNIDNAYVNKKLAMLLVPFLGRWSYARTQEQIAGGQKYRPPVLDAAAPDLYVPLMALWTYALLVCAAAVAQHKFSPAYLSDRITGACVAWGLHWAVVRLILRAMNVPGIAWSELLAYTGYPFLPACISTAAGLLAGRWAYYACWAYGSLAMGTFLVRSIKQVVAQETHRHGADLKLVNYLLLGLAALQFPYALWLGVRPAH